MSCDHDHGRAVGNLKTAFLLNLAFTIVEIAGGLWTNSIAVLADAVHDGGDVLTLGLSWYLQRMSQRQRDAQFTYGYRRFSVLGALISGIVLVVGVGLVLWHAVPRLWSPPPVHAPGMMGLAVLGILVNGIAFYRLHRGQSLSEQVIGWHLLEDVLGWTAVLLGGLAMSLWNLPQLDPLLSIGISLFILWKVIGKLRRVGLVFLQSVPEGFDLAQFTSDVESIPKVLSTHHTHVWTLDGQHHVLTTHLVMEPGSLREDVVAAKARIIELLRPDTFIHATIAIEFAGEPCEGIVGQSEAPAPQQGCGTLDERAACKPPVTNG
jgi:cobalt-zinc-cadmium efflux system protein